MDDAGATRIDHIDDVRIDPDTDASKVQAQSVRRAVSVDTRKVMEDSQAVPVGKLRLVGLNGFEPLGDLRGQIAVSTRLTTPFRGRLTNRPLQPSCARRRAPARDEDSGRVKAVVERGPELVQQFSEYHGELDGKRQHAAKAGNGRAIVFEDPVNRMRSLVQVVGPHPTERLVVLLGAVEPCAQQAHLELDRPEGSG